MNRVKLRVCDLWIELINDSYFALSVQMIYTTNCFTLNSVIKIQQHMKQNMRCLMLFYKSHRTRKWKQIFVTQYEVGCNNEITFAWNPPSRHLLSWTQFHPIFPFYTQYIQTLLWDWTNFIEIMILETLLA